MSIENKLDILIAKIDEAVAISNHLKEEMVNKITVTELENILDRLTNCNNSNFVSKSEFNELKEQVLELNANLKQNVIALDDINEKLETEINAAYKRRNDDYISLYELNGITSNKLDRFKNHWLQKLEELSSSFSQEIENVRDKISTDYVTTDDLYQYTESDEFSVLENIVHELELRLDELSS